MVCDRRPSEIIHCSAKSAAKMAEKFDSYGDSYTEEVTVDDLRRIFTRVHDKVLQDSLVMIVVQLFLFGVWL